MNAYVDISAAYNRYPIFYQGKFTTVAGASASTPVVASVVALLNDYLVSQGESPLGFMNPFLYKKGSDGLRDIVNGNNNECNKKAAFPARR